jgi:hypothetical protein
MKKILLLLIFTFCFFGKTIGQVGYILSKDLPLADIAGTGTSVTLTPTTSSGPIPIGFDFKYWDNTFTELYINPTGTISFGAGSTQQFTAYGEGMLASGEIFKNFIAYSWMNSATLPNLANTTFDYFTTGTSPNKVMVINVRGQVYSYSLPYPPYSANAQFSVQIQLFEGPEGKIELHNTSNATNAFLVGQVGIEGQDGLYAKMASTYNANYNIDQFNFTGQALRFTQCTAPPKPSLVSTGTSLNNSQEYRNVNVTITASGSPVGGIYEWEDIGLYSNTDQPRITGATRDIGYYSINSTASTLGRRYSARTLLSGCESPYSNVISIAYTTLPFITTTTNFLSCNIPSATLTAVINSTTGTYNWYANNVLVQSSNSKTLITNQSETTTYFYTFIDNSYSVTSEPIVINGGCLPSITIDNSTPTQICGIIGSSFVVNFTKVGSFASANTKVSLYERKEFVGTTIYNTELLFTNTATNTATLTLNSNLESSHGGGSPNLSYSIVVTNGTVSASYPVVVSSPESPSVAVSGTLPITTLGQTISLNTAPIANITKQWYKSTPVYFNTNRPVGTAIPNETGNNLTIVPEETAYYSVKYTDQSGCSSISNISRIPITFSLTGTATAADNSFYTEGPLEFGIYSNCGGGTGVREPIDQYLGNLYDAGTHYYAFLGTNDGCYGFNAYFIFRKNNIWGVYYHYRTSSGGGAPTYYWARLFHTKDPFPTIPGARVAASPNAITNTVPPANVIWINDATGEEIELNLDGATEVQTPLPLTLITFTGKQTELNENTLTWKTANEKAFSHFEIQKSVDGKKFEKIGNVFGSKSDNYEFIDTKILFGSAQGTSLGNQNSSLNFYRLKMIDLDGSYNYSKIINIENKSEKNLVGNFYPNPAKGDEVAIDIQAIETGNWTIKSYTQTGQLVNNITQKLQKGINKVKVDLGNTGFGIRYIQIESKGILEVRKVVKE